MTSRDEVRRATRRASTAPASQAAVSAGNGSAATCRALSLTAWAESAVPAYLAAASATTGGASRTASACQSRSGAAVSVMTGTDGSQAPASSTTASTTRPWVATSTFGTSRARAHADSDPSARSASRSTSR